jgi:predicted ATPase
MLLNIVLHSENFENPMKILKFNLANYKSFRSSGWLDFSPGFTVVIGRNNSGKSALIESFRLVENNNHPHRMLSLPPEAPLDQQSFVDFELSISGDELRNTLLTHGGDRSIPVSPQLRDDASNHEAALTIFDTSKLSTLNLKAEFSSGLRSSSYPSHNHFKAEPNIAAKSVLVRGDRRTQSVTAHGISGNLNDDLPVLAHQAYPKNIYVFKAERLGVGKTDAVEATILRPDATNLAAVLGTWQGASVNRFAKYNEHITEILPSIQRVSVAMVQREFEIRVSQFDPKYERDDLAIPLQDCGTGVGQVLAILYVAMTVKSGVIVIDEPNSFLHPGAAKKLIQILSNYEHQYILATHSADLIATAKPGVVHLVKWEDGQSKVEQIDSGKVDDLRNVLVEIGVSFSDLFGYDRAIWVEGPTEEICFPLILERVLKRVELGLIFVAVRNTGDFEKKRDRKKLIWEIYEKLSSGGLLLPTAVSFSFDREDRIEQDIDDLRRQSKGRAHFISRLTYENYLLVPEAIAALVNSLPREGKPAMTPEGVTDWLKQNGGQFGAKWNGDIADIDWLAKVHAPQLLKKLLNELVSVGDNFEKTSHSKFLTLWLIDNRPDELAEIAQHIGILADGTLSVTGLTP